MEDEGDGASRRHSVSVRRTDIARWIDRANYLPFWDSRAVAVGPLLGGRRWVCDIGCGQQALFEHLGAGTFYMPADIHAWTADTESCEINEGELPWRSLLRCDVAVMLGVLEYVFEPASALCRLSKFAEHLLLTYCASELWDIDRASFGWVNALSEVELRRMLDRSGFTVAAITVFDGRQLVVQATNRNFGPLRRLRRLVARRMITGPVRRRA